MISFDQEKYIETSKGIIKELLKEWFTDLEIPVGLPDLASDELNLVKPVIYIGYDGSTNLSKKAGRNTGRGTRHKRKLLRFTLMIINTGESSAVMQMDRIAQEIEAKACKPEILQRLAGQGLKEFEANFINAYKVREGVHITRMEIYCEINIIN